MATPTIRLSNSILAWVRGCVQFVKLLQETSPEVFEGLPPSPDARHLFPPGHYLNQRPGIGKGRGLMLEPDHPDR